MFKNISSLILSLSIAGSLSYGYIFYQTNKNFKENQQILKAQTLKDASRLTNDSFGISWGFQADDTIMKRLDSGDLMFVKYDCSQSLSVYDYVNCYRYTMFLLDQEFHTAGIVYRTQQVLQVIYNQFGKSIKRKYSDFVGLPYIKELSIQKTDKKEEPQIHKRIVSFMQQQPNYLPKKQSPIQFINNLSKKLDLRFTKNGKRIGDIRQIITRSDLTNVRTQTNRTLRSL